MEHTYKLKYKFDAEKGEFKKADFDADYGGCDHLLLHSIIHGEDGSYSSQFRFYPGTEMTQEEQDSETFKACLLTMMKLGDRLEHNPTQMAVSMVADMAARAIIWNDKRALEELNMFIETIIKPEVSAQDDGERHRPEDSNCACEVCRRTK